MSLVLVGEGRRALSGFSLGSKRDAVRLPSGSNGDLVWLELHFDWSDLGKALSWVADESRESRPLGD